MRQFLASVILGMTLCSMEIDSWDSTRTSPGRILSPCIRSPKFWSCPEKYFFPESKRNSFSSFLKNSWKPSCTQLIIISLNFTSSSMSSLRSRWNSWSAESNYENDTTLIHVTGIMELVFIIESLKGSKVWRKSLTHSKLLQIILNHHCWNLFKASVIF